MRRTTINEVINSTHRFHLSEYPLYIGSCRLNDLLVTGAEIAEDELSAIRLSVRHEEDEFYVIMHYQCNPGYNANNFCEKIIGRTIQAQGNVYINHPALAPCLYTNKIQIN